MGFDRLYIAGLELNKDEEPQMWACKAQKSAAVVREHKFAAFATCEHAIVGYKNMCISSI